MKRFIEALQFIIVDVTVAVIGLGVLYGAWYVVKTGSYQFFYEGMVERTVIQMVKPECLN